MIKDFFEGYTVVKSKKFTALKIILAVVISFVLGFGIYMWNAQTMGGNSLPMPLGFGIANVLTDSMHPTISANDVIVVVPQKEYKVGDIVAFQSEGIVVTHRIIEINEDGNFVTKGDAYENDPDTNPLEEKYVFGKVIFTIPNMGGVVKFFKEPVVVLLILLAAILLFMFSSKKEKETETDELAELKAEIAKLKGESSEEVTEQSNAPPPEPSKEDIQAEIDALKKQLNSPKNKNGKGKKK